VVGLYLNPPEAAVVLCVDEKSQIQALDRTAPILPLLPGTPQRRSHDYPRHGTTNLYAALNVASGMVISQLTPRHRAIEFKRFLQRIDQAVPVELDVHVICDNSSTHYTPEIRRWLLRHPRFQLHFTPTYSSWLNLVERWFAELTSKWLKRGTHRSVSELERAIQSWIDSWNDDPRPFVWTKPPTRSSRTSPDISSESPTRDTSGEVGPQLTADFTSVLILASEGEVEHVTTARLVRAMQ
jgi:transposase